MKKVKYINVTSKMWVRTKNTITWKVKLTDIYHKKHIIEIDSIEPPPERGAKVVISKGEANRIQYILEVKFAELENQVKLKLIPSKDGR